MDQNPDVIRHQIEETRSALTEKLETLENEVDLRADGMEFVDKADEPERSLSYRAQLNSEGSPTNAIRVMSEA